MVHQREHPPEWVDALTKRIFLHWVPEIIWYSLPSHTSSTGFAFGSVAKLPEPRQLEVTAGSDVRSAKVVFLHECAHLLAKFSEHPPKFWDIFWRLMRQYGQSSPRVTYAYALEHEAVYRVEAIKAAQRADIPGSSSYPPTRGGITAHLYYLAQKTKKGHHDAIA